MPWRIQWQAGPAVPGVPFTCAWWPITADCRGCPLNGLPLDPQSSARWPP